MAEKKVFRKIWVAVKSIAAMIIVLSMIAFILTEGSYVLRYKEDEKATTIFNGFYALEKNSIDIAYVGSSAIYRYNSPALLYHKTGYSSYNVASGAIAFESIPGILSEIRKYQNPQLYVIDIRRFYISLYSEKEGIYDNENSKARVESNFSAIVNNMPISLARAKIIHDTVPALLKQKELEWQFDYFRTHTNWKNKSYSDVLEVIWKAFNKKKVLAENHLDYMGDMTKDSLMPLESVDVSKFDKKVTISKEEYEPLDKLMKYIKKHKLNVLFMSSPYQVLPVYYAYELEMEKYLEKNGFKLLNCNKYFDKMGLDFSADFYNDKHVNTVGAYKYTNFVADYIKKNYDFETCLTDKQKAVCNEEYHKYVKDILNPGYIKLRKKVIKNKKENG